VVEPSDVELARGLLDALARGLDDVARTLANVLAERQRARRPANVLTFDPAGKRGR
jgi:hypothetical protein